MEFILPFLLISSNIYVKAQSKFSAPTYYWSMTKTEHKNMLDEERRMVSADLYGVNFEKVRRLRWAASLRGRPNQWIGLDASEAEDYLAFKFAWSDEHAISLAFWARMREGRRVLATGSYTNSSSGAGILITYDGDTQLMHAKFADPDYRWQTSLRVPKYTWCHVSIAWKATNGLTMVLDGRYGDKEAFSHTADKIKEQTKDKPFTKMITIGRPENILDRRGYGDFDIAHLAIYNRELNEVEMRMLPTTGIEKGDEQDLLCCTRKENHKCYKDPCLSQDCANLEQLFTNCVCPDLQHKTCKEYPTTQPPVTLPDCEHNLHQRTSDGCKNKLDIDVPICGNQVCYYGMCHTFNNFDHCQCPAHCPQRNDTTDRRQLVCGSDGVTYVNRCVMMKTSCRLHKLIDVTNEGPCGGPLSNATHYWPLGENKEGKVMDKRGKRVIAEFLNRVRTDTHPQIGKYISLDGVSNWIDIRKLDLCIMQQDCEDSLNGGISLSFWMKFDSGDYIFQAGGYASATPNAPGFRLQRNPETRLYHLTVATTRYIWELQIYKFPTKWFHFAFTWNTRNGLKLYIDGELSLSTDEPIVNDRGSLDMSGSSGSRLVFAQHDTDRKLEQHYARYDLAHLAVWKKSLTARQVRKVFAQNVLVDTSAELCCYKRKTDDSYRKNCGRHYFAEKWERRKQLKCICPDVRENINNCKHPPPPTSCTDNAKCDVLVKSQKGFCKNSRETAEMLCPQACNLCTAAKFEYARGPQKHFSKETLIFSLVGCVTGVLLLIGVTFYFWKVYRTRYHGAFVPPMKKAMLDESNDFDDKWSTKYVDTSAFYIKDVPAKKRTLPLVPVKINHKNQRYQPPEYD